VGLPYKPFTDGANCLFVGHSFFIPIARKFDGFVELAQASNNIFFSQHNFGTEFSGGQSGSPGQLWDDVGHRTSITAKLATGNIDLFGMTSFDGDEDQDPQEIMDTFFETSAYASAKEYIPDYTRWIDLALSYNLNTSIFLGWHWATYNHLLTTEEFTTYNEFQCGFFFNSVVKELRQMYPYTQILYICYGPVASIMRQMFEDGNLPDIENQIGPKDESTSLFTDDARGHAGDMMTDMMGLVWFQILYDPSSNLIERYINRITTWNKENVYNIIEEGLVLNEDYNLKEEELTPESTTSSPTMEPSQQPSMKPSMVPTISPTSTETTEGIGLCFPNESLVQVLRTEKENNSQKRKVAIISMEQLQIDDLVLTISRTRTAIDARFPSIAYERVYSFAHYDPNESKVEYLRLLPSGLELSANHYVYRIATSSGSETGKGGGQFVPAREIKVGDDLLIYDDMTAESKQKMVTGIQNVHRRGALAPLTSSGTIVVNGVLASTYASFFEDNFSSGEESSTLLPSWIQNQFHEWSHFVTVILRFRSWISSMIVGGGKEHHTPEGLSVATDQLRNMTTWYFRQASIIKVVLAAWLLPSLGLLYVMEQMYYYVRASTSWAYLFLAVTIFVGKKMTNNINAKASIGKIQ